MSERVFSVGIKLVRIACRLNGKNSIAGLSRWDRAEKKRQAWDSNPESLAPETSALPLRQPAVDESLPVLHSRNDKGEPPNIWSGANLAFSSGSSALPIILQYAVPLGPLQPGDGPVLSAPAIH